MATTITVSSSAALASALKTAHAGDTILLASGTYSGVTINSVNIVGNVTIASADPQHAAVFTSLTVNNSSGLTFSNIEMSAANSTATYAFSILRSSNINLQNINMHGSLDHNPGNDTAGLLIENSSHVNVSGSQFQQLSNAITELNNSNISITGNSFHDIRSDGIDNAGSSYVQISNNSFTDFYPASSTQHPDAIQFWTTNTTTSAHDISITGNTISAGSGGAIQGIFMKDEVGNLPFQNVTVSGNTVSGEMWNGIQLNHIDGGAVTYNTVAAGSVTGSWLGISNSTGIDLSGNSSSSLQLANVTSLTQTVANTVAGVVETHTVYSGVSTTLGSLSDTLILTGSAHLTGTANNYGSTVVANNAGDNLYDGTGNDTLIGGTGNDYLASRAGCDILTGGAGNNTFFFNTGIQHDVVTDFAAAGDRNTLNLSKFIGAGFTPALHDVGADTLVTFAGSSATILLEDVHSAQMVATSYGWLHY